MDNESNNIVYIQLIQEKHTKKYISKTLVISKLISFRPTHITRWSETCRTVRIYITKISGRWEFVSQMWDKFSCCQTEAASEWSFNVFCVIKNDEFSILMMYFMWILIFCEKKLKIILRIIYHQMNTMKYDTIKTGRPHLMEILFSIF